MSTHAFNYFLVLLQKYDYVRKLTYIDLFFFVINKTIFKIIDLKLLTTCTSLSVVGCYKHPLMSMPNEENKFRASILLGQFREASNFSAYQHEQNLRFILILETIILSSYQSNVRA